MSNYVVDFDEYVDEYEELLRKQLSFFNSDHDFFSAYKIEILKQHLLFKPERILDFGCGIGRSLPHLMKYFPDSKVFASDISQKSRDYVRKHYKKVEVLDTLDGETFDLVFLSGVVHHVPPKEREPLMIELKNLLSSRGIVCIFEHNPYNPVTRKMVSDCPFDKGVVLISQSRLQHLMKKSGLQTLKKGYCLFFPEKLKGFRHLEKMIKWLPLGGQHFILGWNG